VDGVLLLFFVTVGSFCSGLLQEEVGPDLSLLLLQLRILDLRFLSFEVHALGVGPSRQRGEQRLVENLLAVSTAVGQPQSELGVGPLEVLVVLVEVLAVAREVEGDGVGVRDPLAVSVELKIVEVVHILEAGVV